jgi:hypothetical protein
MSGTWTEDAQRAEQLKHAAPVCERCGVQPAVCGCEPASDNEAEAPDAGPVAEEV